MFDEGIFEKLKNLFYKFVLNRFVKQKGFFNKKNSFKNTFNIRLFKIKIFIGLFDNRNWKGTFTKKNCWDVNKLKNYSIKQSNAYV